MPTDMNANFTRKIRGGSLNEYSEFYSQLAMAVVSQAVKDYREALANYKRALNFWNIDAREEFINDAKGELRRLEKFFHSGRYSILTNIDPDIVIRKVRQMEGIEEDEKF